jgi:hypothetical protein
MLLVSILSLVHSAIDESRDGPVVVRESVGLSGAANRGSNSVDLSSDIEIPEESEAFIMWVIPSAERNFDLYGHPDGVTLTDYGFATEVVTADGSVVSATGMQPMDVDGVELATESAQLSRSSFLVRFTLTNSNPGVARITALRCWADICIGGSKEVLVSGMDESGTGLIM